MLSNNGANAVYITGTDTLLLKCIMSFFSKYLS